MSPKIRSLPCFKDGSEERGKLLVSLLPDSLNRYVQRNVRRRLAGKARRCLVIRPSPTHAGLTTFSLALNGVQCHVIQLTPDLRLQSIV